MGQSLSGRFEEEEISCSDRNRAPIPWFFRCTPTPWRSRWVSRGNSLSIWELNVHHHIHSSSSLFPVMQRWIRVSLVLLPLISSGFKAERNLVCIVRPSCTACPLHDRPWYDYPGQGWRQQYLSLFFLFRLVFHLPVLHIIFCLSSIPPQRPLLLFLVLNRPLILSFHLFFSFPAFTDLLQWPSPHSCVFRVWKGFLYTTFCFLCVM
jgi:hypothetical protein